MTVRRLSIVAVALAVALIIAFWRGSAPPGQSEDEAVRGASSPSRAAEGNTSDSESRPAAAVPSTSEESVPPPSAEGASASNAPGSARLAGKVITPTDEPIPGARLTLAGPRDAVNAVTDSTGQFAFDLEPGQYRVTAVQAEGYTSFHELMTFSVEAGQAIDSVVFVLRALDAQQSQVEETGDLPFGGTVVDAEDRPVSGATVRAQSELGTYVTTSGSDGHFEFGPVPGGVFVTYATYGEQVSEPVSTSEGTRDAVLRLEIRGGFIAGRVTDPDGGAHVSFSVLVSRPVGRLEERTLYRRPFASGRGDYRIGPLTPGDYRVRADASGFATSEPETVKVVAGETAVADLQLRRGASLAGRVVDAEDGQPIAAAVVSLESGLLTSRETKSAADGRFMLTGLPPGLFSVRASAEGFHRRSVSGLRAIEGQSAGPVDIRLNCVQDDDEEPRDEIAGIGTGLRPEGDALVVTQVVAGGGAAEVGLRPGDRIVTIDGRSVGELDFNGVVQLIRGPAGSRVLLTIQRDGQTQTVDVPRRVISN